MQFHLLERPSSLTRPARSFGPSKACSQSPTCIWRKARALPRAGQLLPPYDTAATLARLARLIARYAPRCVTALGDSFHDGGGPTRLSRDDRENLKALQRGRDWIWLTGNHDPEPAADIGGVFETTLTIGALTFCHLPTGAAGEIAGHLHPVARVAHRGRAVIPALLCGGRDASW